MAVLLAKIVVPGLSQKPEIYAAGEQAAAHYA